MKPLHVICVSTYSSVAEAYKCALKGISGSQKKQTREDVCSAVVSDHYCMFNRWQPLGVFSSWRSWCLHSSSRSHCMCVRYCLCVQWCSCNYCRLFFFFEGQPPNLSRTCLPAASVALRKDFNKALVSVYQHTSVVPSLNNLIFTTNMLPV